MQATRPILRKAARPVTRVYPLPVPDSCIFHMDMAQANPQLTDHSRMRRHGTNSGSTRVGGPRGTIRDFDGTNDYIQSVNPLRPTRSFELWLRADTVVGGHTFFNATAGGDITQAAAQVDFSSDNWNTTVSSASDALVVDTWRHIVITETSGAITNFYANGARSGTADQNAVTVDSASGNVWVGGSSSTYFDGKIGLVRCYDRVLTLAEIKQLFRESAWRFKVAA